MKLVKKVSALQVKRTYVTAGAIRIQKNGRSYLGQLSRDAFLQKLQAAKQKVLRMSEHQLDSHITGGPGRLASYEDSDWYIAEVKVSEIGVWRRAGELPLRWTNGSLEETADKVRRALSQGRQLQGRARHTIANMLATNVGLLQQEHYLLPIAFKGNTGTRGRKYLKRVMKFDIDDGCMRSIALAVQGTKVIRVYAGFPKGRRAVH